MFASEYPTVQVCIIAMFWMHSLYIYICKYSIIVIYIYVCTYSIYKFSSWNDLRKFWKNIESQDAISSVAAMFLRSQVASVSLTQDQETPQPVGMIQWKNQ